MTSCFNPLNHNVCFENPQRLVFPNAWVTHIPFAMYIMSALKPSIFVELGTHIGNSYCGFCQAVENLKLETKCFAVDTWKGDEHAGFYGSEVFEELSNYHDPKYGSFSRLLKMTFDEAKEYFSDRSITLLHIDGLHTYDAVKHDFENWKPKLTENAVVIFHDVNVREREFGVWKFWEELTFEYPHLEFLHGNGLGVICQGKADQLGIGELFDPRNLEEIRTFFSSLGEKNNFPIEKAHLGARLSEQKKINEKMLADLKVSDQQLATLKADRATCYQELATLKEDLAACDQELATLKKDLAACDQELTKAKIAIIQNQKELIDYAQSTSWIITRPLRKIGRMIRGENYDPNLTT